MVYCFKSCESSQLLIIPSSSRAAYIDESCTFNYLSYGSLFWQLFLVEALKLMLTFRLRCPTLILRAVNDVMNILHVFKRVGSEYDRFHRNKEGFSLFNLNYYDIVIIFSIYLQYVEIRGWAQSVRIEAQERLSKNKKTKAWLTLTYPNWELLYFEKMSSIMKAHSS